MFFSITNKHQIKNGAEGVTEIKLKGKKCYILKVKKPNTKIKQLQTSCS